MEGVDIPGVLVPDQIVDPLAHFIGRFIGKCNAQDVPGKDPHLIDQKRKPMGQRPGFARTCTGHHPDDAFCRRDGFLLFFVQQIVHLLLPPVDVCFLSVPAALFPAFLSVGSELIIQYIEHMFNCGGQCTASRQ